MPWIDLHCDTIYELMRRNHGENLCENSLSVNVEGLRNAGSIAQFFAAFIYAGDFQVADGERSGQTSSVKIDWDGAYAHALDMLRYAKKELAEHSEHLAFAGNLKDLHNNVNQKKISAFLTIEEGGILNGKMERLGALYQEGVRLMTLTWNYENCIGYPNSREEKRMMKGLKPFGFELIGEINRKGMLIDVSHLSDGGFWDVIKYSKMPVVASHSNARALCPHPRNLSDEMIRVLAGKGGVIGLNFYPYFLNGTDRAGVDDLVRHIKHMYRVGGEDVIALGTDFDGFDDAINELDGIGKLPILSDALSKQGFSERQLEKFCYGNAERMMRICSISVM